MLGVIGINHKSAPVSIREKFAFTREQIEEFSELALTHGFAGIIVLSTCNRSELYFDSKIHLNGSAPIVLRNLLFSYKGIQSEASQYFFTHVEQAVVNHLFQVICGYDSLALGEYQIVSQVKSAYTISQEIQSAGKLLTRLFHKAFETSKKVRTTTEMNRGAASVSYAAVELASRVFGKLNEKRILLVGAGETSELVLLNLRKRVNNPNITIVNRTLARAQDLAHHHQGLVRPWNELSAAVADADIVLTSTGSQVALIDRAMLEPIMAERGEMRPLLLVDLSVPRNVADNAAELQGVTVHDVDDLQAVVAENYERRKAQLESGIEIIERQAKEFSEWLDSQKLSPTLQAIQRGFMDFQKTELQGFKKFAGIDTNDELDRFGERISQKYFQLLARNIREVSQNGRDAEVMKVVQRLFEIN